MEKRGGRTRPTQKKYTGKRKQKKIKCGKDEVVEENPPKKVKQSKPSSKQGKAEMVFSYGRPKGKKNKCKVCDSRLCNGKNTFFFLFI